MSWNSRRPGIEIEFGIIVEVTDLRVSQFIDGIAVAHGHISATGTVRCFQDGHVVAGAFELVCDGQARKTSTENCDFHFGHGVLQVEPRHRSGVLHESECHAGLVNSGSAASGPDQV